MVIKYNARIDNEAIVTNIERLTNQIFKLLPNREEGGDWKTPLQNLIIEIAGMDKLLLDHVNLFSLLCKLEALLDLDQEDDFFQFRKIIFECLGLMNGLKKCLD
jgi:hypothetical protein